MVGVLYRPLRALLETSNPFLSWTATFARGSRRGGGGAKGYIAVLSEDHRVVFEWPAVGKQASSRSLRPPTSSSASTAASTGSTAARPAFCPIAPAARHRDDGGHAYLDLGRLGSRPEMALLRGRDHDAHHHEYPITPITNAIRTMTGTPCDIGTPRRRLRRTLGPLHRRAEHAEGDQQHQHAAEGHQAEHQLGDVVVETGRLPVVLSATSVVTPISTAPGSRRSSRPFRVSSLQLKD